MAASAAKVPGQGSQGQSGEEVTERLQRIAQQQGSVNQRTGQITPMKLGQQAQANQLRDAAAGQEKIAEELSGLADRLQDRAQTLGDLQALALEAQALAERLAREILDIETLQRQERLFHRLLDAGRSLEKDEYSEERESSAPGQCERNAVEVLSPKGFGRIRMRRVPDVSGDSLVPLICDVAEPGSEILTDGWGGYNSLTEHSYTHSRTVLSDSGDPAHVTMPGVHRIAALLKRWLLGIHQGAVSGKHLEYYLDEYTFRFNRRTSRSRGMLFYRLMQQAVATASAPYQQLVGGNHKM